MGHEMISLVDGNGEDPGSGTYETFAEVCHWGRREERCSSDSIGGLRGEQKAIEGVYVELLGKIRIISLFLILKVTQSLLKIS